MGDKARMVGEGINYQADGLYFGEIIQIQGFWTGAKEEEQVVMNYAL